MHSYPVVYISFAEMIGDTYESVVIRLKSIMMDLYYNYKFLLKSDKIEDSEKERINNVLFGRANEDELTFALKELCRYLRDYYGVKPILLIDEYDVPLQEAYVNGIYNKVSKLVKSLYLSSLKLNPYLKRAVVTRSI